jgi:hypothetical protein
VHSIAPGVEENLPAGQFQQPHQCEYLPGTHDPTFLSSIQDFCAGFVVVFPSEHISHSVALAVPENLPTAQFVHFGELNSEENLPIGQSLQKNKKCLNDPGIHAPPQVIGPQHVPTGHFRQVMDPGTAEYSPPAHVVHLSE